MGCLMNTNTVLTDELEAGNLEWAWPQKVDRDKEGQYSLERCCYKITLGDSRGHKTIKDDQTNFIEDLKLQQNT